MARAKSAKKSNGGPLGYEDELRKTADELRNDMCTLAGEYVVDLGSSAVVGAPCLVGFLPEEAQ